MIVVKNSCLALRVSGYKSVGMAAGQPIINRPKLHSTYTSSTKASLADSSTILPAPERGAVFRGDVFGNHDNRTSLWCRQNCTGIGKAGCGSRDVCGLAIGGVNNRVGRSQPYRFVPRNLKNNAPTSPTKYLK